MTTESKSQFNLENESLTSTGDSLARRWLLYFVWVLVCMSLFQGPLRSIFNLAAHSENFSHIFLIPLISTYLLFLDRRSFESAKSIDYRAGVPFLVAGALLTGFLVSLSSSLEPTWRLALFILALLLLVVSGFAALFGRSTARKSWFPFAFLLLAIPLPDSLLNRFIYALQAGSASITDFLFELSGVPFLREGFVFRLPVMSIEVAQECSGIRSSMALLVLAILVSHFAFHRFWKKAVFVAAGLVMMIVKNGVRIATLTLLANYVNPDFLLGRLHRDGGVVFFLLGLLLLLPVYWLLRKGEAQDIALERH
jgi:exosortase